MGLLENSNDGQKPLFRKWAKSFARNNPKAKKISDFIIRIKLSSSEEWIIIEGKESVALLNAESKAGRAFWDTMVQLNGQGKALLLVPARGKLGFDVEIDTTNKLVEWEYDEDEGQVINNFFDQLAGEQSKSTSLTGLKVEDILKP